MRVTQRIRERRPCTAAGRVRVWNVHVSSGKDAGLDHEYELVDCITIVMCGGSPCDRKPCVRLTPSLPVDARVCSCARTRGSIGWRLSPLVTSPPRGAHARNDASPLLVLKRARGRVRALWRIRAARCTALARRVRAHSLARARVCAHALAPPHAGTQRHCVRRRKAATLPLSFKQLFEAVF